ncbi:MAG: hypothetical protein JSS30_00545 [Verrucomicrobia bacterium]|nr:hypothetical protein [Verrucomicrobiota bacterium]
MFSKSLPFAVLTVLGLTSAASAARNTTASGKPVHGDVCAPSQPAVCYPDDCPPCQRCLGPENFAGNPPVCPAGCNGDVFITAAAVYWSSHQDGMEYAIDNEVTQPVLQTIPNNRILNQLANAEYKHPGSHWDWGFKLGIGYCSSCDGWDVNLLWTWYRGRHTHDLDTDNTDNHSVIPLWTNFVPGAGGVLFATDSEIHWKLKLNLVDLELGRGYWVSRYLNIRPFVGLRYASIKQDTAITYRGGSWAAVTGQDAGNQNAFNDYVDLENDYRGAGLRAGLGSEWNFGCGWALYGNLATSIIYGRFDVDHKEYIRLANITPHSTADILDTNESLRALRAILDLDLGIQWSTMFCSCKYGLTVMLGWESHLFFDQNQLWRVSRVGTSSQSVTPPNLTSNPPVLNLSGDNVLEQRRGSLDTSGWTLTFKFDF